MSKRRFTVSRKRATTDFYRLMTDLDATSLKINQDIMTGEVQAVFDRGGWRYVFECDKWGNVDDNLRALFGHNVIAGMVTEQIIGGGAFVRVDVPATNWNGPLTKFFGTTAICAITPVAEQTARDAAARLSVRPVTQWVAPSLPAPKNDDLEDDF